MKIGITGIIIAWLTLSPLPSFAGSFRVLGLSQIEGMEQLEFVAADGIAVIPVSISSVSKPLDIPKSGQLNFYRKAPENPDGEAPVLSVQVKDVSADVILLFRANLSASNPTYSCLAIEDSAQSFPPGSVLMLNLSPKLIAAKLGEHKVRVKTGEKTVVNLVETDAPFDDGVMFAAEFDGFGKIFSTSSWYLVPSMKILCIVYSDQNGNPQIRRIRLD